MSRILRLLSIVALLNGVLNPVHRAYAAAPSTGVPAYDRSVKKAVDYLKQQILDDKTNLHGGYLSLCAYAVLKAGEAPSSPAVKKAIDAVKGRINSSGYKPSDAQHHIYEAGVDGMLLADAGEADYYNELKAISDYIIAQQGADGSWDYPSRTVGDTSMGQYGALGLWAAKRAGVEIPRQAWDKAAMWHIRTQHQSGGFIYHPGRSVGSGTGNGNPTLNMTAGATGTLAICRLHLYPGFVPGEKRNKGKEGPKKAFGILEPKVDESTRPESDYKPQATLSAINTSIAKGLGWLGARFRPVSPLPHKLYFVYALERTCALNNVKTLGSGINWYQASGDVLVKNQLPAGTWKAHVDHAPAAFAILFYLRPTKQAVAAQYGAGLLTGGRGLPTDLANADLSGGKIKEKRKMQGPLDELLTELSSVDPDSLADAQAAIVEKVQLGNREELVGELDRIRKLIDHPNAEVRRTAVWALGRSGNLKDADLLITRLREDFNVDVLVEAYNSLSYLSRKIDGVGMKPSPFAELEEDATQAHKDAAVKAWREEAISRWSDWYLRIRPYEDRNDLFELGLGSRE